MTSVTAWALCWLGVGATWASVCCRGKVWKSVAVKTCAVSLEVVEFCGPPMCILLICVFKLPRLLNTQLHSVQLYVGPFFTSE